MEEETYCHKFPVTSLAYHGTWVCACADVREYTQNKAFLFFFFNEKWGWARKIAGKVLSLQA